MYEVLFSTLAPLFFSRSTLQHLVLHHFMKEHPLFSTCYMHSMHIEQQVCCQEKDHFRVLMRIGLMQEGSCSVDGEEEDKYCMLLNNMSAAAAECVRDFILYTR